MDISQSTPRTIAAPLSSTRAHLFVVVSALSFRIALGMAGHWADGIVLKLVTPKPHIIQSLRALPTAHDDILNTRKEATCSHAFPGDADLLISVPTKVFFHLTRQDILIRWCCQIHPGTMVSGDEEANIVGHAYRTTSQLITNPMQYA
ncbi:hypothetical protein EDD16DRAFT_1520011 [Pisolithus croceorrhizus]|nr:hypothetical protein EDD16DRAFT_1520011 [Pisolithus croceorrhizus]